MLTHVGNENFQADISYKFKRGKNCHSDIYFNILFITEKKFLKKDLIKFLNTAYRYSNIYFKL